MSFEDDDDFFLGEQTNSSEELLSTNRARLDFFVGYSTKTIITDEQIISESSKGLRAFCEFISSTLVDLQKNDEDEEFSQPQNIKTPEQIFLEIVDEIKPPNVASSLDLKQIIPLDKKSVALLKCDGVSCSNLLTQHIITRPCSHMLCMDCVKKLVQDGLCPSCEETVLDISELGKVTKQIQCLKVKCPTVAEEENHMNKIAEVFPCVDDTSIKRGLGEESASIIDSFKRIAQLFVMFRTNKYEDAKKNELDGQTLHIDPIEIYGINDILEGKKDLTQIETTPKTISDTASSSTLKKRNSILFTFLNKEQTSSQNVDYLVNKTIIEAAIENLNHQVYEKTKAANMGKSSSVIKKMDTSPLNYESISKIVSSYLFYSYITLDENSESTNATITLTQFCRKPGCEKTTSRLEDNFREILSKQCPWKGMLKNVQNHLNGDCGSNYRKCSNQGCQFEAPLEYLHTVHASICPFAQTKCPVCGTEGIFRADMLSHVVPCLVEWYVTNLDEIKKFIEKEKKSESETRRKHIINLVSGLDLENDKTIIGTSLSGTLRKKQGTAAGTLYKTLSKNTMAKTINDGKERCSTCQCVTNCTCHCHEFQKIKHERELAKTLKLKNEEEEKKKTEAQVEMEKTIKELKNKLEKEQEEKKKLEEEKSELQKSKDNTGKEEKKKKTEMTPEDNIKYVNYVSYILIGSTIFQLLCCFHGVYEIQIGKMRGMGTLCILLIAIPIFMWKNITDRRMSTYKGAEKEENVKNPTENHIPEVDINSTLSRRNYLEKNELKTTENKRLPIQVNFLYNHEYIVIAGMIGVLLFITILTITPYKKEYYEDFIEALIDANSRHAAKQVASLSLRADEGRINYTSALIMTIPISIGSLFVTKYLIENDKKVKETEEKLCKTILIGTTGAAAIAILMIQITNGSFIGIIKSLILGTIFSGSYLVIYICALLILPDSYLPEKCIEYKYNTLKANTKELEIHQLALPFALFPQVGGIVLAGLFYFDDKLVF